MGYRELSMIEVKELLRLWVGGKGIKPIARQTSVGKNTVRRYIAAAEAAGLAVGEVERIDDDELVSRIAASIRCGSSSVSDGRQACRERKQQIAEWARQCDAPKIRRLLKRDGVDVPLRTLQRFMREELGAPKRDTVRLQDPDPGVLEFDFLLLGTFVDEDGDKREVSAALMTAAVSRHQFLWPCLGQTRDDVIEALEAGWAFFGGVFPILLPDNLRAVVTKSDPVSPRINSWFLEYAQSRDFEIDPARVRKPRDKAKVERQVRYVRRDFFGGERFRSLGQIREAAEEWCRDLAGRRTHQMTRRAPIEHFTQTDARVLKPAPETPYDTPLWSSHTVGRDHAITVQHALYSVPHEVYGEVEVRTDRSTVKIYRRRELVKVHGRVPSGQKQLDPTDAPPGAAEVVDRSASALFERATKLSPVIGHYARQLAPEPRRRFGDIRRVWKLIGACETYGADAVEEACSRALELDVVDVRRILGMLEKGLEHRRTPQLRQRTRAGKVLTFERPASAFALDQEPS